MAVGGDSLCQTKKKTWREQVSASVLSVVEAGRDTDFDRADVISSKSSICAGGRGKTMMSDKTGKMWEWQGLHLVFRPHPESTIILYIDKSKKGGSIVYYTQVGLTMVVIYTTQSNPRISNCIL